MARPDFPRTLAEFQSRFAAEEDCRRYLMACRWPDGFHCPRCGKGEACELATRELVQCKSCRHQASVTAGTVLHRTRVPLRLWFAAAYLVTTHTPGFSAAQLQRQLGLDRYETAWTMLQKLRRAMLRPDRDRLAGVIEVDETYVGGVEAGRRGGRQRDSTKSIVVGAVEARRRLRSHQACRGRRPDRDVAGGVRHGIRGTGQRRADGQMARLRSTPPRLRSPSVDDR
jgi:transposase-like protein